MSERCHHMEADDDRAKPQKKSTLVRVLSLLPGPHALWRTAEGADLARSAAYLAYT